MSMAFIENRLEFQNRPLFLFLKGIALIHGAARELSKHKKGCMRSKI